MRKDLSRERKRKQPAKLQKFGIEPLIKASKTNSLTPTPSTLLSNISGTSLTIAATEAGVSKAVFPSLNVKTFDLFLEFCRNQVKGC